ncbi:MAG: hypothetical protein V1725_00490 [archaeon]
MSLTTLLRRSSYEAGNTLELHRKYTFLEDVAVVTEKKKESTDCSFVFSGKHTWEVYDKTTAYNVGDKVRVLYALARHYIKDYLPPDFTEKKTIRDMTDRFYINIIKC